MRSLPALFFIFSKGIAKSEQAEYGSTKAAMKTPWKVATLLIVAVLFVAFIAKLAYERGYGRGQRDGRVSLTKEFVDSPHRFLIEAQLWCVADTIDGYKTVGLWQKSAPEAQQILYKQAEEHCKTKVREAAPRLSGPSE